MQILRTATLAEIRDGILAHQLDAELVKIHADIVDRPLLQKPRKVTLTISITPTKDFKLDGVEVDFMVTSSTPATSIVRRMKSSGKRNGFVFDPDTDSVDHGERQQRRDGIDNDED